MPTTSPPTDLATVRRLRENISGDSHPEHFHVALLGLSTYDSAKLHERVRQGLSYEALERLRRTLGISLSQFAALVGIPPRTLARRKTAKRLSSEESDRLLRLSRITGLTLRLFEGALPESRTWLIASNPALGGAAPLDFATTEIGAREVENLIGRLEYGIPF